MINMILDQFLFEIKKITNRDAGTFKVVSQMKSMTAQKYYYKPIYLIQNESSIVQRDILLFQLVVLQPVSFENLSNVFFFSFVPASHFQA